jgi:hypothetical protein
MELTISIKDKKVYASLLQFLKSIGIKVEAKKKTNHSHLTTGEKMAQALEKLAKSGGIKSISNPLSWQKESRKDRDIN